MNLEDWLREMEGFSLKIERAQDDLIEQSDWFIVKQWLQAAWDAGYEEGLKNK